MKYYNYIYTISKYTFIEAVKNRLFLLLIIFLICIFGLAEFVGELAVTESREIQGSIAALILRLMAVFIIVLFVLTSTIREINDKGFEFILSLPAPRYIYYFGKLIGFSLLAVTISVVCVLPLLFYADFYSLVIWGVSLICELIILVALCLFCIFTLSQITTAFSIVIGFYILSRSMNAIQLISESPIINTGSLSQQFINYFIDLISYILPGLDRFTQTEWLIHNSGDLNQIKYVLFQTIVYIGLLSSAALFDLYRKNF